MNSRPLISSRAVSVSLDKSDLPLTLKSHDEYEFVAHIDATPGMPADGIIGASEIEHFQAWTYITWNCACLRGSITTCQDCPPLRVPNFKELYASIQLPQRVNPREMFEAEIIVTNPTGNSHHITLLVDPSTPQLLCMRRCTDVGEVPPMGTVSVHVPLVAVAHGAHSLNPMSFIVTGNPQQTFLVRERCTVFCTNDESL